jgi:hypothetical protein
MPMSEEERRRCCALGGCGCGSGGPEQRAALRAFLLEKLESGGWEAHPATDRSRLDLVHENQKAFVDKWLDELFVGNPALSQDLGDDG